MALEAFAALPIQSMYDLLAMGTDAWRARELRTHDGLSWEARVRAGDDALWQDFLGPGQAGPLWHQQDDLRRILDLVGVLSSTSPAGRLALAAFLSEQLRWTGIGVGLDERRSLRARWTVGSLMEVIYLQLLEHVEERLAFGVGHCHICDGPILNSSGSFRLLGRAQEAPSARRAASWAEATFLVGRSRWTRRRRNDPGWGGARMRPRDRQPRAARKRGRQVVDRALTCEFGTDETAGRSVRPSGDASGGAFKSA